MALWSDLAARGVTRAYRQHTLRLEPILQAMSVRGLPVNPSRYAEVHAQLTAECADLLEKMRKLVPPEARLWTPKTGYKKVPKDLTGLVLKSFPEGDRYVRLQEWKPAHHGLIRYMRIKDHPVPKDWKSGKETIGELELTRLAKRTGDPLYTLYRQYSDAKTLLSNHLANWKPGADGLVHPSFYYDTATGQLGARRPNSMNAPHHKESQGPLFRSMIIAPPEHVIVELDYSGFHSLILGFLARDLLLMRMTRIDVHSFVTAHFKKLPGHELLIDMKEDELRDRLGWVKKNYRHDRDAKVKHAFLGYNNGMGYRKLWFQYMEYFESQGEAKRVLEMFDVLFPNAKKFREAQAQQAHDQGYLISRSGSIRYFWEVYKWKGGDWTHGPDQEAAKCFQMQNLAHGHLKDALIRIDDAGLADKLALRTPIHDAAIFIPHRYQVQPLVPRVASIMEEPSTIMIDPISAPNGLSIGVALKMAKSWDKMIELKNWRDPEEVERVLSTMGA